MASNNEDDGIVGISRKIEEVETQIEKVETKIIMVEEILEKGDLNEKDVDYWRDKEKQLRHKEKQLRDEMWQLRDEEKQRRDKKMQLKETTQSSDASFPARRDRSPLRPGTKIDPSMVINAKIDRLIERLDNAERATPQYSPKIIGNRERERLENYGRFQVFDGNDDQPSLLTELSNLDDEHQVVAYVTPFLQAIAVEKGNSVFNSEMYKWIETSSNASGYNEKPDLIISHPAIINHKPPFKCDEKLDALRRRSDRYGVLTAWNLRSFIGLTTY